MSLAAEAGSASTRLLDRQRGHRSRGALAHRRCRVEIVTDTDDPIDLLDLPFELIRHTASQGDGDVVVGVDRLSIQGQPRDDDDGADVRVVPREAIGRCAISKSSGSYIESCRSDGEPDARAADVCVGITRPRNCAAEAGPK